MNQSDVTYDASWGSPSQQAVHEVVAKASDGGGRTVAVVRLEVSMNHPEFENRFGATAVRSLEVKAKALCEDIVNGLP